MSSVVHTGSSSIKKKMALSGRDDLISFSSDDEEPEDSLCEAFSAKCTPSLTTATPKPSECVFLHVCPADPSLGLAAYVNPLALAKEFSELQQTASVKEYAMQTDDYIAHLNWPDAMAVSGFRRGLKSYIEDATEAIEGVHRVSYAEIKIKAGELE